jgi:hypothetical protein
MLVRAHDHRHRVPARDRADPVLEVLVAGDAHLLLDRNRVDVCGVRRKRQVGARASRLVDQLLDQEMRAVGALGFEHAVERVEPFARFLRIDIGNAVLRRLRFRGILRQLYARQRRGSR